MFFNELMKSLRRDTAEARKESIKGLSQLDLTTRSKLNLHDLLDNNIVRRKRSEVADGESDDGDYVSILGRRHGKAASALLRALRKALWRAV